MSVRILVSKNTGSGQEIVVLPARRHHLPPVVLRGPTMDDLKASLMSTLKTVEGETPRDGRA